jgi:hypothetical protein
MSSNTANNNCSGSVNRATLGFDNHTCLYAAMMNGAMYQRNPNSDRYFMLEKSPNYAVTSNWAITAEYCAKPEGHLKEYIPRNEPGKFPYGYLFCETEDLVR